jgi:hypothetical protein
MIVWVQFQCFISNREIHVQSDFFSTFGHNACHIVVRESEMIFSGTHNSQQ